jgi:hypothetical protein
MSTQFDFSLSPDDGFLVSGGVGNFMHGAGLFDLRGYNAPASGFHVLNTVGGGLGEGFYVDRVQMNNNGQYGFLFNGDSTPLHLGHLSCHGNVVSGVGLVSENESHVQIEYVAGDNNGDSLIIIMSTGISTSINIMGWKSERWGSTPGNPNIFHVVNANGGYLQIGPGRYTSQVATQPNAIIHIESGSNLNLKIEPISSASNLTVDYLYGINWVALTKTSTATALKLHSYTNVPALTL